MSLIVFVGGAPRSGTSLFQKMLDMHSQIYAGPEFDHLPGLMSQYDRMKKGLVSERQSFYYNQDDLNRGFRFLVESLLLSKRTSTGKPIMSEKTPDNILYFKELSELFPEAKFVFILRDPRAIVNSHRQVYIRAIRQGAGKKYWFGRTGMADLSSIHRSIKAGNDFLKLHPSTCRLICYEDIVRDPTNTMKEVCAFLGVSFEPAMVNTDVPNDASILVSKNQLSESPFVTPLFDKKITNSSLHAWRSELPRIKVWLTEDLFLRKPIDCVSKKYVFEKRGWIARIIVILIRIRWYFRHRAGKLLK